jgi:hypothetical protein
MYQLTTAGDDILSAMSAKSDYDPSLPRNLCWSLASVPQASNTRSKACKVMNYRPPQFDLNANFSYGASTFSGSTLLDNTLYPTTYNPEIRIEITDPMRLRGLAGQQLNSTFAPCTVTVTTYGETLPSTGFSGAGLEVGRAKVTFLALGANCTVGPTP